MTAPPFRLRDERTIHEGYAITLTVATFEAADGSTFSRDLVHHPGAVAVVPLHDDGTITCVRQFRAPIGSELLEIPAGLRDIADEPMEQTAARELAEEAGLMAGDIEHLVSFHNAAGHSDEMVHVYVARDLTPTDAAPEGPEEHAMTIERHPLDALLAMIRAGEVTDVKTIVAISMLASG